MFQARAVPLDNFLKQKITSTLCKLIIQIRSTLAVIGWKISEYLSAH